MLYQRGAEMRGQLFFVITASAKADVLTTTPENFQRDLEYLKNHFQCLALADLCAQLKNGRLDAPSVVVTFDDGYRDNFTQGVPLLKAAKIPATFFVSTGFMSTQRVFAHDENEARDFPKLTWDDLRAMQNDGFEIGSHTVNHADMGALTQEKLEEELKVSLTALNRELGERPRAFAFPYGKPRNVPVRAIGAARRAGYYAAFSAYGGDNRAGRRFVSLAPRGCRQRPDESYRVASAPCRLRPRFLAL